MFECEWCGKVFTRVDNRNRHTLRSCVGKRVKPDDKNDNDHTLTSCVAKKVKLDDINKNDKDEFFQCDVCNVLVQKSCHAAHLRSYAHRSQAFILVDDGVKKCVGIFGDRIVSYQVTDSVRVNVDVEEFSNNVREKIITLVDATLHVHHSLKVNLELYGIYYLLTKENVDIKSFNTKNKIITKGSNLYEIFDEWIDEIKSKMSEFQERDSGLNKKRTCFTLIINFFLLF